MTRGGSPWKGLDPHRWSDLR